MAQKPLSGTYAANVLAFGCGAMNIDGCRVDGAHKYTPRLTHNGNLNDDGWQKIGGDLQEVTSAGRWPTNLVLTHSAACGDECAPGCPVATLDAQSGMSRSKRSMRGVGLTGSNVYGSGQLDYDTERGHCDQGGASRFYPTFRYGDDDLAPFLYCAKPSRAERDAGLSGLAVATAGEMTSRKEGSAGLNSPRAGAGRTEGGANVHPTVKPIALMRWLVRLVTPPGGTVLDPFAGSGTTIAAALREGRRAIGIEMTPEYWPIITGRAEYHAGIAAEDGERSRQLPIAVPVADDADDWAEPVAAPAAEQGRCFTCRAWGEHERDAETRELACCVCQGERHRAHYAAYCERNAMEVF